MSGKRFDRNSLSSIAGTLGIANRPRVRRLTEDPSDAVIVADEPPLWPARSATEAFEAAAEAEGWVIWTSGHAGNPAAPPAPPREEPWFVAEMREPAVTGVVEIEPPAPVAEPEPPAPVVEAVAVEVEPPAPVVEPPAPATEAPAPVRAPAPATAQRTPSRATGAGRPRTSRSGTRRPPKRAVWRMPTVDRGEVAVYAAAIGLAGVLGAAIAYMP